MKKKKQASKRRPAAVARSLEKLGKKETVAHYNAILIEQIDSKMSLVIEGMEGTRVSLETKIDGVEQRLSQRIGLVEVAVMAHSGEFKEIKSVLAEHGAKLDSLEKDVTELKTDMGEVKGQLSAHGARLDSIDTKLDNHTVRLDNLEKGMQRIENTLGEKLNDHETRINTLETPHL